MLTIDPELLLLTVVIFLGLIFVLNMMLYKPILSFIDRRNESIAKDEESLLKQSDDTKAYKDEAESILAKARQEAVVIKNAAIAKANEEATQRIAEQRAILEDDYKQFLAKLNAENEELARNLAARLPEFRDSLRASLAKL